MEFKYGDLLENRNGIWFCRPHTCLKRVIHSFRFRIDPVPFIHNIRPYGRYFRHIRTTQERRLNQDIGYGIKARGKRKNLPNSWDDIYIHQSKSWKDCTKRRKQWEKK